MKAFFVSALLAAALAAAPGAAWSQQAPGGPLRLGIASDLNGPYASLGGKGALLGAQMAVEDFGGTEHEEGLRLLCEDLAEHGGLARLPQVVTTRVATDLAVTGRRVGSDEALHLGLASRLGDVEAARAWAAEIAQVPPHAVRSTLRLVGEPARPQQAFDDALVGE